MIWRLAFPLILLFAPRLIPRLVRTVYLTWKLLFDNRVPLLLKLLLPASLIYFVTPIARLPYVGPVGYLIILWLAVSIFINLAPRRVVEEYAPWRSKGDAAQRTSKDSARVVEGSYRLKDDEEPPE